MSIIQHDDWDLSEKGVKDAERHRKKIDKAIRENVKNVIGEESIITDRKGKKVRIPVRGLKDYRFIYGGNDEGGAGVGQGDGEGGDVIGQKPKQGGNGQQPGGKEAGDQPGIDYIETEVDIEYLIQIMFDDLGLPWIEEKRKAQHLVPKGWKFDTISKKGIQPRIHKKRTLMEAVKRMVSYAAEIMEECGCTQDEANSALIQARGDLIEAIEIMQSGKLEKVYKGEVFIEDDDLRYKQIDQDVEYQSKAVIICMMDTSGSMTMDKKYLARSMLFWLVEFLRKVYDNVEVVFITHTTEANVVDEDTFFYKGESGGTRCASAFELANYKIETEFPLDEWNVYCVYLSDGEDFDTEETINEIDKMLKKKVNMLSYVEITPDYDGFEYGGGWRTLLKAITKKWKFEKKNVEDTEMYRNDALKFLISIIKKKEHIFPALKHMLFEKRK
jgi:sporulation protein YhbH